MPTPGNTPQTDAEWARNTEQRLRALERRETTRVGEWVISSQEGELVATKPDDSFVLGEVSSTTTTEIATRSVSLTTTDQDQLVEDVTDAVNQTLQDKIDEALDAAFPGWETTLLGKIILTILGIPGSLANLGSFFALKWTELTNATNNFVAMFLAAGVTAAQAFGELLAGAWAAVQTALTNAADALNKIGSILWNAAVDTVEALGALIASAFATAQTALTNAAQAIGQIGTILWNAAVETVEELGAIIASALAKANTALTNAGQALGQIGGLLGVTLMETMEGLGALINGSWAKAQTAFTNAGLALSQIGDLLVRAAVSTVEALGDLITGAFSIASTAATNALAALSQIGQVITTALVNTAEALGNLINQAVSTANTAFTNAANALGQIGTIVANAVVDGVAALGSLIAGAAANANTALTNAASALGQIGQMITGAVVGTAEALGSAIAGTISTANTALTNAGTALGHLGDMLGSAAANTFGEIGEWVTNAWEGTQATWNNFWGGVFGGNPTGKTAADVKTAAASVNSTATTASTNATNANTTAAAASTATSNLTTGLANTPQDWLGSIGGVIMDGVASVGTFLSSIWDGLTGGSGSTGKTVAQVKSAAASVTSTANTAQTNAGTAITNAGTANTNLQGTWNALYNAVYGTGYTDRTIAQVQSAQGALTSTASTGVTNAATAQSTANSAQTTANTANTNAGTALTNANTANTNAGTALTNANTAITNAGTANTNLQTTWNNLTTSLANQTTQQTGTTTTTAQVSKTLAANAAANTQAIAKLQTPPTVATTGGGRSIGVDFATRTASTSSIVGGAASVDFTVTLSGSGTSTYGIINGAADWSKSGTAGRTMTAVYTLNPLTTDYQVVTASLTSWQGNTSSGYSSNSVYARMNSTGTTYVYAKVSGNVVELGYSVNGARTAMTSATAPSGYLGSFPWIMSATSMTLICGTSGGSRQYKVLIGSEVVINWTESGVSSQQGSTYRYVGFGSDVIYGSLSGSNILAAGSPVSAFVAMDNAPATYLGSGFRAYRNSAVALTMPTSSTGYSGAGVYRGDGREYVPFIGGTIRNFFDTLDYKTSDLTFNVAADGTTLTNDSRVTVSNDGWYYANLVIGFSINTMVVDVAPVLFKNSTTTPFRKGPAGWGVTSTIGRGPSSVGGSFMMYLKAGDYLIPGYWATPLYAPGGSFLGDTRGLTCYFELTLMNRSFF